MSLLKGKWVAYAGFAIAAIAFILSQIGVFNESIAFVIVSVVGFPTGVIGLRAYIASNGIKSFVLAAGSVVVGLLLVLKVLTVDTAVQLFAVVASLCGVTITQATEKAQT